MQDLESEDRPHPTCPFRLLQMKQQNPSFPGFSQDLPKLTNPCF